MKIAKLTQVVLITGVLALLSNQCGYSQSKKNTDIISVQLSVIGEGKHTYLTKDDFSYFFTTATIFNNQDTAVKFWVMNCSWPVDNWVVDNDSVVFAFQGCDNNTATEIKLLPHSKITFNGLLKSKINNSKDKFVKVGFIYFTSFKDIFENGGLKSSLNKHKKYWSNSVELVDNVNKYIQ